MVTLRVTTAMQYGNACAIEIAFEHDMPVIRLTAHPHGGPEVLWFCFRIEEDAPGYTGPVRWVLRQMANLLGAPERSLVRPVMRIGNGMWQRLAPGRRLDRPDGQWDGEWMLEVSHYPVEIAFCYPYGPDEVDTLVSDSHGYWHGDTIGVSQAGRRLLRLANDYGSPPGSRPGIYAIARQHSGETPGSWVLDGFLRRMKQAGERAPLIWTVPLTNIDGVVQGDYGKDNFPYDLNRAWGIVPMRHETRVCMADLLRWRERCRPLLCLDFHAPSGGENAGVYAFLPPVSAEAELMQAILRWAERFSMALTDQYAASPFGRFANYPSRWETPTFTAYCAQQLGIPSLSFETPYAEIRGLVLTPVEYREIGSRLADSIIQFLAEQDER